jgi:hypothetical protein
MRAMMEFMQKPENRALAADHEEHWRRMREIPFLKENWKNRKLVAEFLSRPENAVLKAEFDSLRQATKKRHEDMEKYVREHAAKRKRR